MKYTLQYYNRIQETDSEERKKELMAKGYQLVKVDGKLVVTENKQKDLETAHEELMKAYEKLQKIHAETCRKNEELTEKLEGLTKKEIKGKGSAAVQEIVQKTDEKQKPEKV